MPFTYDLSSDRGKLRLELGDTDADAYVFNDDEIDYFLAQGGSVTGGLKRGIQALITSRAYRIKRASSLGLSIDDTKQVTELRDWLKDLGGFIPEATTTFPKRLPSDRGFNPTSFS